MLNAGYLVLTAFFFAATAAAQQGGDRQAQILYAYQTEDANALANLVQDLATRVQADEADPALRYHLAHAQYRRALLAGRAAGGVAQAALSDCIDELKPAVSQEPKAVEALVLQSACYAELAEWKTLSAALLRTRCRERLAAALKMAPRNPRAVYISSQIGLREAAPGTAERQRAFAQLQLAAQLFEATSATSIDVPGWGHAEAYLALGRELQARGDHLNARNWIEKSLIVAPDYKAAQRQLSLLTQP